MHIRTISEVQLRPVWNFYYVHLRRKRIAEMTKAAQKAKYRDVMEITKADWVQEVNKAGDGVWVVLHVYKQG